MILENPNDWIRVILETGSDKDMLQLEHELLTCLDAAKSEYSYNRTNGARKFCCIGSATGKNAKGIPSVGKKAKGIPATGKYAKGILRGPIPGKYAKGIPKTGKNAKGVPKSGKHAQGISRTPQTGKGAKGVPKTGKNAKGVPKAKVICPHCNKSVGIWISKHFDNCKFSI